MERRQVDEGAGRRVEGHLVVPLDTAVGAAIVGAAQLDCTTEGGGEDGRGVGRGACGTPAVAEVDQRRALGALGVDGAEGEQGGGPLGGEDAAVAHVAQREGAVAGDTARADRDALERLAAQRLDRVAPEGGDGAERLAHATTPLSFQRAISSQVQPSSSSTSSVCAPASCAARRTTGGSPANWTGFAHTRTVPSGAGDSSR